MNIRTRKQIGTTAIFLTLFALLVVMLFPLLLVGMNSFKTEKEFLDNGPFTMPQSLNVESFHQAMSNMKFFMRLWNSILIAVPTAVLAAALSLLNGYAIGIGRVRGKMFFLLFFLIGMMLPAESLIYPVYHMFRMLKLYNTRFAVILCMTAAHLSFGTYLLASVLGEFPREFVEAAQIDGAGKLYVLWKIIVPLVMPTLSVLIVFFFIWTWNDFFFALIMLASEKIQTLPLGILHMQGQFRSTITLQSAGAVLLSLPCVIFFVLFQRTLTSGITASGLKG